MKTRLLEIWERLRTSYWFVPGLMVIGAALASVLIGVVDARWIGDAEGWPDWLRIYGSDNARALLSTIAGSMITVAGVTFSIVMIALSLASSQLGPRLLVGFMRDYGNQVVLGTFVATFLYCVLVLRQIGAPDDGVAVPQLSVTFAVALAIASIGVLIYFFHHVSVSIQAEYVIAQEGERLEHAVRAALPPRQEADEQEDDDDHLSWPEDFDDRAGEVAAGATGYLGRVNYEELGKLAEDRELFVEIVARRRALVVPSTVVARVHPAAENGDETAEKVAATFQILRQPGVVGDVEASVERLAEIAMRALSPGINDPLTAISCIDRIGTGLALLAERGRPPRRRGPGGRLRVPDRDDADLLAASFAQILLYGGANPRVLDRLLTALGLIAAHLPADDPAGLRAALVRHTEATRERAAELPEDWQREAVEDRFRAFEGLAQG